MQCAPKPIRYNIPMNNRYTDGTYFSKNPSWHSEDAPWKLSHILRALKQARLTVPKQVLDAGCGSGDILKLWASKAPHVRFTGWDISAQAYALALRNAPSNVRFIQSQYLPKGPFDLALAIDVIEHVENPQRWLTQLAARAPLLVLHVPLDLSLRSYINPNLLDEERRKVGHIHFFTARSLKRFLRQQHCEILAAHYTNKYVERPPELTRFKSRVGMCIRQAVHYLLPHAWAAYLIGGYSLMLVVKTNGGTKNATI